MQSNELYHHGIKGQKWGVKNGPPYPLKDGAHSKAEADANPKLRSSSSKTDAGLKKRSGSGFFESLRKSIKGGSETQKQRSISSDSTSEQSKSDYSKKLYNRLNNGESISSHEPEIEKIVNSKEINKAYKDYRKSAKDYMDFYNDEELVTYYKKMAAEVDNKLRGVTDPKEAEYTVFGYLDDDYDQGDFNSFQCYLLDKKNADLRTYSDNVYAKKLAYENAVKAAVGDLLGKYADVEVDSFSRIGLGWNTALDEGTDRVKDIIEANDTATWIEGYAPADFNLAMIESELSEPGIRNLDKVKNYINEYKEERAKGKANGELPSSEQHLIRSMEASGYTIAEISDRLGISTSTVSKYADGRQSANLESYLNGDSRLVGSQKSLFSAIGKRLADSKKARDAARAEKEAAAKKEAIKKKRLESLAKARETAKLKKQQALEEQKKQEAHDEEKRKAIASGDPEQISKYLHELTNDEQNAAITRINQVAKINSMAKEQAARNAPTPEPSKYDRIMSRAKTIMARGSEFRQLTEDGIKIYNTAAAINNAFNKEMKLPQIDLNPKKEDKKKDKDKDVIYIVNGEEKDKANTAKKGNSEAPEVTVESSSGGERRATSSGGKQERQATSYYNEPKSSTSDDNTTPYYTYEDGSNAQKLLTKLSGMSSGEKAKATESGVKYWMTVVNGGGSYHGSSSESNSNYYKDRSSENKRYDDWEAEQRKASASRMAEASRRDRERTLDAMAARLKQARDARDDASKRYQRNEPLIPGMSISSQANEVKELSKVVEDIYDEIRKKGLDYDEIQKRINN